MPKHAKTHMLGCMQPAERALLKPERQRLIVSMISSRSLRTQHELQSALAGAGCEVTQATISRDLRELGVKKGRDQLGQPRFTLAEGARRGKPEDALASVLRRFALRAVSSQNLVVVRCELGTAPAVAQALELASSGSQRRQGLRDRCRTSDAVTACAWRLPWIMLQPAR